MGKRRKFVPGILKFFFILSLILIVAFIAFLISGDLQDRILRKRVQEKTQEIKPGIDLYSESVKNLEAERTAKSGNVQVKAERLILDQQALNEYIAVHYSDVIPAEIREWAVELDGDTVILYLLVDLSAYAESIKVETGGMMSDVLNEGIGLILSGKLTGKGGTGTLKIEKMHLGAIPLPLALVSRVVEREIEKQGGGPPKDVFSLPFLLPENYQSLHVREGWVILEK